MVISEKIDALLQEFKKGRYLYGSGCLRGIGKVTSEFGGKVLLIRDAFTGSGIFADRIRRSLGDGGLEVLGDLEGIIRPNAPQEDMHAVRDAIQKYNPDVVISFGGGSTIDAVKAAIVLAVLKGDIEEYFGVGKVTEALNNSERKLIPHIAVQSAASSAAHLTKYSNITNLETKQKKLIVDEAVVPDYPVFDYEVTYRTPRDLTLDGALDGMSHCMEVFFSSAGKPAYPQAKEIASLAIDLIVASLPRVIRDPEDQEARDAICAATDLGGYAIMVGGTSGAHLTSFSLVDVTTHGRACAVMNPYYAVFYAPAIPEPLQILGNIYRKYGHSSADFDRLSGRELGLAFAEAMIRFGKSIGFPTKLAEFDNFTHAHIGKALDAAKNPQLKSKLENMPVPLTAELVDEYMGSILNAAETGDLSLIKNL